MDEDVKFLLTRIQVERMQLKSKLMFFSHNLRKETKTKFTKEIDTVLDRLNYLEKLEEAIRKKCKISTPFQGKA